LTFRLAKRLVNGWRMTRLPDPKPSSAAEGMMMG
jgi:hypothetical protein